jgi:succinate dehydrogenase / fumarate reductase cytochrome b subunit
MSTSSAAAAHRSSPLTEKLTLSLLGVVPLGVYVVMHLWTNMHSLFGAEAFDAALRESREKPAFIALEIFGLGLPIVVHAWLGIRALLRSRYNNATYGTLRNLKFLLQRLSGLGVLLFLGAHVVKARLMPAANGTHETWAGMHEAFCEVPTLVVYSLGMLGISFHLGNGLWGAGMTLGLTVGPKAQKRMEWVSGLFFVVLLVMSGLAIYGFRPFMDVR